MSDQTASDLGFVDGNTSGDDYTYDHNGNLSEDKNKHIESIEYNLLNLPEVITFRKEGQQATLQFLYDATGNKLRKTVTDFEGKVTTTDYIAGMQYTQVDNEPRLLELIHHEEGRVVPKQDGSGYAYHYDLRDHLGNTRVTFSSETQTDSYSATMEPELATDENILFGNVIETRQLDQLTNSTEPSITTPDPRYSARLNATQGRVVGPAKSLPVKKDDKVTLSVDAFYFGTDSEDNVGAAAILPYVVGAFTGQGVVDGQALGEAIELGGALLSPALFSNNNGGVPYAYLNFMFFDENFVYQPLTTGGQDYVPVSDAAQQNHETLAVELTMPTSGYLYVYVSNESNWNINVFFDELSIEHEHSPVVTDASYYPFGGLHSERERYGTQYLYNGKELQDELGLGWYDYGARFYDPWKPGFTTIDPLADQMRRHSPYSYAFNNPTRFIDPDGMKPVDDYYDRLGNYLYTDNKQTDNIMIVSDEGVDMASLVKGNGTDAYGKVLEANSTGIKESGISGDAVGEIYTDILGKAGYDVDKLHNGVVSTDGGRLSGENSNEGESTNRLGEIANTTVKGWINPNTGQPFNYSGDAPEGTIKVTANYNSDGSGTEHLGTVSNVINVLGEHELKGHGVMRIPNTTAGHAKILKMQKAHPSWKNVTKKYKEE